MSWNSAAAFSELSTPLNNPFFTGGFGLALVGGGFALMRRSWSLVQALGRRHLLSTMEITSKDRAFPWVLQFLTANGAGSQHVSVETTGKSGFGFVPGPGVHLVKYKNKYIAIERTREHSSTDFTSGKPWERVTLTMLGRQTSLFASLLKDSFDAATLAAEGKTIIYTNWGAEWRPFGQPRVPRPLHSVVLDEGISSSLLEDIQEWRNSSNWYITRGIPYRRGYLLHGPPGSGKSSFITAIAGHLRYNICVLNLAESGLTDDRLILALSTVPPQSVVLLEDIDAAFVQREAGNNFSRLTFSGLLNALDGVASTEERLVFMTTNHLDRLDEALIRPGRVDRVVYLGPASLYQLKSMFASFYPLSQSLVQTHPEVRVALNDARFVRTGTNDGTLPDMAEEFAYLLFKTNQNISMAQLQGYLMVYKNDALEAFKNISSLKVVPSINSQKPARSEKVSDLFTKSHKYREVSGIEVDKMFYNPQNGAL